MMEIFASSRLASIVAAVAAMGAMVCTSGCGKSRAAAAQNPPPQSLSEPVRVSSVASVPDDPPAIPVSINNDYGSQKTGESRELPSFIDPARPAAPVSKPAAPPVTASTGGNGKYHTMQKGETLYAVSRKYNVKPKALIDANNFKDPNHLAVGTKVFIP
jgi:LysM repeat protein